MYDFFIMTSINGILRQVGAGSAFAGMTELEKWCRGMVPDTSEKKLNCHSEGAKRLKNPVNCL